MMPMGISGLITTGFDEVFLYLTIPRVLTNLSITVSTQSPQKELCYTGAAYWLTKWGFYLNYGDFSRLDNHLTHWYDRDGATYELVTPVASTHLTLSFYHILHSKYQVHPIMYVTHHVKNFKDLRSDGSNEGNNKKYGYTLTTTHHYSFARTSEFRQSM